MDVSSNQTKPCRTKRKSISLSLSLSLSNSWDKLLYIKIGLSIIEVKTSLIYRCFVNCQLNKSVTDRRMDNLRERLTNRRFIIIDRLCIWVTSHWLLSYLYKMNLKCLCVIKCSCIKASEIDQLVLLFSLCHE